MFRFRQRSPPPYQLPVVTQPPVPYAHLVAFALSTLVGFRELHLIVGNKRFKPELLSTRPVEQHEFSAVSRQNASATLSRIILKPRDYHAAARCMLYHAQAPAAAVGGHMLTVGPQATNGFVGGSASAQHCIRNPLSATDRTQQTRPPTSVPTSGPEGREKHIQTRKTSTTKAANATRDNLWRRKQDVHINYKS